MLISRDHQIAELRHAIDALFAGESKRSVLFVTGEAGIGKSTLLDALRAALEAQSPPPGIAIAACSTPVAGQEIGGVEALEPWARIMGSFVSRPSSAASAGRIVGELAMAWVRVIPVVGDILESAVDTARIVRQHSGEPPPPASQQQMFQQYVNVLTELSARTPLVLMLDDAHWADASSANLLFTAARQLEGRRVAFVVAYRPADAATGRGDDVHPILHVRSELERYGLAHEVGVPTLDPVDIDRLLRARYRDYHNDDDFERWLVRISGGNALFVTQFLATLEEDGHVDPATGTIQRGYDTVAIPPSAQAVIEERVRRLSEEMREMLRYASVEGDTFTTSVLARVTEMPQLRLLQRLRLVEETHALVQSLGRRRIYASEIAAWRFTHILVQKVLYDGLGTEERRMIHEIALEVLRDEWSSALEAGINVAGTAARIAAHATIIGDHATSARMLIEGARASWRRYAERETLQLVEEAFAALERAASDGAVSKEELDELRSSLLGTRAEVHRIRGRLTTALDDFTEAIALDAGRSLPRRAKMQAVVAEVLKGLRRFDEAEANVRAALEDARRLGDATAVSDALRTYGNIYRDMGRPVDALRYFRESLAAAEEGNVMACMAKALDNIGQACRMLGDYDEARRSYERSGELSKTIGDDRTRAILLNNIGALEYKTGRLDEARARFLESGAILEATGDARLAALSRSNIGDIALVRGEYADALEHFRAALEITRRTHDVALVSALLRNCAEALHGLDRNDEARTSLAEARAMLDRDIDRPALADFTLLDARMALASGDLERARTALDECAALAPDSGEAEFPPLVEGWRGVLAAAEARAVRGDVRRTLLDRAQASIAACIAELEPLGHLELPRWRQRLMALERDRAVERDAHEGAGAGARGDEAPR